MKSTKNEQTPVPNNTHSTTAESSLFSSSTRITNKQSPEPLIKFEKESRLSSEYPALQGYLLEHSSFTLSTYVQKFGTQQQQQHHQNQDQEERKQSLSGQTVTNDGTVTGTNQAADHQQSSVSSVVSQVTSAASSSAIGRRVAGALRKKRWLIFTPKTGKLYKFRGQNDSFPLEELDIRTSSFIIHRPQVSGSVELPFVFEIVSGAKTWVLEANSPKEGFAWIENLQTYRQVLCNKHLGVDIPSGVDTERQLRDVTPNSFISYISNINNTQESKANKVSSPKSPTSGITINSNSINQRDSNHSAKMNEAKPKMFSGLVNKIKREPPNTSAASNEHQLIGDTACPRCKELQERLIISADDQVALEDELKSNRQVINILQQQLRIFNSENTENSEQNNSSSKNNNQIKDYDALTKENLSLKLQIKFLENENNRLVQEAKQSNKTREVLQEMLENRDRTMVSLTHQVYDLESKNSRMSARAELEKEFLQEEMDDRVRYRLEQLQDTVLAFEHQNEFLNKEIIQQNEIRAKLEQKEKQTQAEMCELEAKCSQVQSKLLSLLKELNQCIQEEERHNNEDFHNLESNRKNPLFVTNDSVKLLVNRLLEESSLDIPLSWRPGNRPRNWQVNDNAPECSKEYDELGFYITGSDPLGSNPKCYDLNMEADMSVWRNRWDQFMSNISTTEANLSALKKGELKTMLRNGVPQDYRCKIWKMLVNRRVFDKRSRFGEAYYDNLIKICGSSLLTSTASPGKGGGGGGGNASSSTATAMIDPSTKQIELDLLRTLPHNRHFENLESEGIKRLRKVLQAFSLHNQSVGYCQGLNRLAAVTLLFMPEEEAFWTLVAIVETIMPNDYFSRNLLGAHVDQCVLRDLIAEKLPQLSSHMDEYCIEISLFGWFLTAFVDSMPVQVYLHIWDVFLNEGSKVLFRFALAILKLYEPELLLMNDSVSFNQFLRTLGEKHFDLKRLSDIAFKGLNPFSTKSIQNKRQHYMAIVKDELKKIEDIRDQIHCQIAKQDAEDRRNAAQAAETSKDANKDDDSKNTGKFKSDTQLISFDDDSDN